MFLHLSVILSGGCLPQCMLGYTNTGRCTPWQVHPLAGTHPQVGTPPLKTTPPPINAKFDGSCKRPGQFPPTQANITLMQEKDFDCYFLFSFVTRMHSSRMRTIHSSSRLSWGGGACLVWGGGVVPAWSRGGTWYPSMH